MIKNLPFIHLRVYSDYSFGMSSLKIEQLVSVCYEREMPALCLSDRGLFGALEFSLKCCEMGVQPIIGCSIDVEYNHSFGEILLIAKTYEGYKNLMKLSTRVFVDRHGFDRPSVDWDYLAEHSEGLIVLLGATNSNMLLNNKTTEEAKDIIKQIQKETQLEIFLELTRYADNSHANSEAILMHIGYDLNLPFVATNPISFLDYKTYEAADVLLCIVNGRFLSEESRPVVNPEHYYKTEEEMKKLFSDFPEAIENTAVIAQKCEFFPKKQPIRIPKIGNIDANTVIEEEATAGLIEKLKHIDKSEHKKYFDRLHFELDLIQKMHFSDYFLIVSDFIKWSKENEIAVGPGRGSGVGSIVAWCLQITQLDPIAFGLIFERFLNPKRVSMPDFDIDLCQLRRDDVIEYTKKKYGYENVAHIITFGKLQARGVLRDVGRILQIPYGLVDSICKMIPQNMANPLTLQQAIDIDPQLQKMGEDDPVIKRLLGTSLQLEGCTKHISTHATGIIIADKPIIETMPLYMDVDSKVIAGQFSMKYVEAAGLIKFDFLGLKTLTVISTTCKLIEKLSEKPFDVYAINLKDKNTYKMLSDGDVMGVFQLEGSGMREALKQMQPDHLSDIMALTSLYRPGPMENIPTYIKRKHGREINYSVHEKFGNILDETYGVIVYQEQVMQIAQAVAGYSLGEADILRRAMGKKDRYEMHKQRAVFVEKCGQNKVNQKEATEIFNLIEKFASYGFNKSHAAAYSLITYQTAFLKNNHMVEFLVASLNLDITSQEKVNTFCNESKKNDIEILPPDINESAVMFSIEIFDKRDVLYCKIIVDPFDLSISSTLQSIDWSDKIINIRYGLAGIKSTGIKALSEIVAEREKGGKFKNFWDFVERTAIKGINKRLLEQLIKSGAINNLYDNQHELIANMDSIMAYIHNTSSHKKEKIQQQTLISLMHGSEESKNDNIPELTATKKWNKEEKGKSEYEALGFYLTLHPMLMYMDFLKKQNVIFSYDIPNYTMSDMRDASMAGVVKSCKIRSGKGKRAGKYAFLILADPYGDIDISVFDPNILQHQINLLKDGQLVFCNVSIKNDSHGQRILLRGITSFVQAVERSHQHVMIEVSDMEAIPILKDHIDILHEYTPNIKGVTISIVTVLPDGSKIKFKSDKVMCMSYESLEKINHLHGVNVIR